MTARVGAAERRVQLLDVATDLVASGGVRALTMDAVAAKAGVYRPVVYRHFENAEALLDAVVERELAALRSVTDTAVAGIVGLEPRLRAAVTAWMDSFARAASTLNVALVGAPSTGLLKERRARQNRASMRFLVGELRAGGLTPADADVLAAVLLHGLVGLVALWRAKRVTRPIAIDRFVAIALGGVAALVNGPTQGVSQRRVQSVVVPAPATTMRLSVSSSAGSSRPRMSTSASTR